MYLFVKFVVKYAVVNFWSIVGLRCLIKIIIGGSNWYVFHIAYQIFVYLSVDVLFYHPNKLTPFWFYSWWNSFLCQMLILIWIFIFVYFSLNDNNRLGRIFVLVKHLWMLLQKHFNFSRFGVFWILFDRDIFIGKNNFLF